MKSPKSLLLLLLVPIFGISTQASSITINNVSKEERSEIIKNIPIRLSKTWPEAARDAYLLACMSSAHAGNDAALASLIIIADSADVINTRIKTLESATKSSNTKKELYIKMQKFNTVDNFKKSKMAATSLPNALKYCRELNNQIYRKNNQTYDPMANFAKDYLKNNK